MYIDKLRGLPYAMSGVFLPLFLLALVVVLGVLGCVPLPYALLFLALVNSPSKIRPLARCLCCLHVLPSRLLSMAADTVLCDYLAN